MTDWAAVISNDCAVPDDLGGAVERHLPSERRWLEAFTAWWPAEEDTRGWDERLGWLHAVAHGADLAGSFGARLPADELPGLLTTIARRVVAPTGHRYEQMEEDRVAWAAVRILRRPELSASAATGWLGKVDELFATGGPGPLPVPVANTLAVLRATYVMADRHAVPHRTAVRTPSRAACTWPSTSTPPSVASCP